MTNGTPDLPFGRIYLDSNIFISAHDESGDVARLLLEMLEAAPAHRRAAFATSELTLAEVLVRAMRRGDEMSVREFRTMLLPSDWLDLQSVSRTVLISSAHLRAQHQALKLPDAIHVASAFACECTHFLSADLRLRDRYSVGASTLMVLVPTVETLTDVIKWLRA